MATWNVGSISNAVQSLVEGIPTAISGAILTGIADRQIGFAETYTGQTIGSTSIDSKWQPALVNLTAAEVLNYMNLVGADVSSISLGELSISKGGVTNVQATSDKLREMGLTMLKEHGRQTKYYVSFN
jgi:hypothetical protein